MEKKFASKQQKLFWYAFFGKCGEEFMGNPCLMEGFMELERARQQKNEDEKGLER